MVSGKRSLFVDTSGWIEVFSKNEPYHELAEGLLARALKARRPIITTNYIITEFVGIGVKPRRLTRPQLFEAIEAISHFPSIEVVHIGEESHALALALLRGRLDKEWSLVDATSFNLMRERGISEALTTDHHFEQAEFVRLLKPGNEFKKAE